MQQTYVGNIDPVDLSHEEIVHTHIGDETIENMIDVSDKELGEFEEESDSASSEYSSDSD
ncbi:unnamed protein product [Arabidopsis halleri]